MQQHWHHAILQGLVVVAQRAVLIVFGIALFCATLVALVFAAYRAVHLVF